MSTAVLSLVAWRFLPGLVTGWVQSIYYSITIRVGDRHPQPNSPRWQLHRRRIYTSVITIYLLYTIYEAHWELQRAGNFYTALGVPIDASDRDIRVRFRRLAAQYHPDKVSSSSSSTDPENATRFFMQLKTAYEVLTNPIQRFAYDRFGPDILDSEWRHCVSLHDYVWRGLLMQVLLRYLVSAAGLYGMGFLGQFEVGGYWRWLTLLSMCAFEAYTVMTPRLPGFVKAGINPFLVRFASRAPYVQFQIITLARRLALSISFAIGQLGPLLQTGPNRADDEKALQQSLDRLEQTARTMDADTARLMDLEMAPFAGDPGIMQELRSKMKEWLVQNTIRADPMVRDALGKSLKRRRVDAPAGARGTK
ncbi:hypothetical protein F4678DRAFT_388554 [Xylaria arbuscula]|nr:hypothetical protein F4678DRAFT_388554 [Xylaria arbuscula]